MGSPIYQTAAFVLIMTLKQKCKHQWRMTSLGKGINFTPYGRIDYHCVDIDISSTGEMDSTIRLAR